MTDGEKVGEVGILKDCDGLIKIVKKSVQNHCKRTSGTLHAVEDELNLRCNDVTGRALLGSAVRCARKVESIYLRDLGVCEKVNEQTAIAKHGLSTIDIKWIDTDKVFGGVESMLVSSRMVARARPLCRDFSVGRIDKRYTQFAAHNWRRVE